MVAGPDTCYNSGLLQAGINADCLLPADSLELNNPFPFPCDVLLLSILGDATPECFGGRMTQWPRSAYGEWHERNTVVKAPFSKSWTRKPLCSPRGSLANRTGPNQGSALLESFVSVLCPPHALVNRTLFTPLQHLLLSVSLIYSDGVGRQSPNKVISCEGCRNS